MDEAAVRTYVRQLDAQRWREQHETWLEHLHPLGSSVVPYLLEFYPAARHWLTRAHLVSRATPYARTTEEAFQLGLRACSDRSTHVRYRACELLAYAQRDEALLTLERLRVHPDPRTGADAEAAIDALKSRNHHYWRDRDHSGRVFVFVWPEDIPPAHRHGATDPRPR
jgi:hypothetical protein